MTEQVEQLLRCASEPLSQSTPRLSAACSDLAGELAPELLQMLSSRNGFTAFGGALQVYPAGASVRSIADLDRWNSPALWRSTYKDLADGCLFFAQDLFGVQFCIHAGAVYRFDPETADKEYLGPGIDGWALRMCLEPDVNTGSTLLRQWERSHGTLPEDKRLAPKIPFVLGGEFEIRNLRAMDAVHAMRFYGDLAIQLHELPDGAQVQLKTVE